MANVMDHLVLSGGINIMRCRRNQDRQFDGSFFMIPIQGDSAVVDCRPIGGDFVLLLLVIFKVFHALLIDTFYTKVVDNEANCG